MNLRQKVLISTASIILPALAGCQICPVVSPLGLEQYQKDHLAQIHRSCGDEVTVAELKSFYTQKYTHYKKFNREVQKRIDQVYIEKGKMNLNDPISRDNILRTEEGVNYFFKKSQHYKKKYRNWL